MATRDRVTPTAGERAPLERLVGRGEAAARRLAHARRPPTADGGGAGPGWTDERVAGPRGSGRPPSPAFGSASWATARRWRRSPSRPAAPLLASRTARAR